MDNYVAELRALLEANADDSSLGQWLDVYFIRRLMAIPLGEITARTSISTEKPRKMQGHEEIRATIEEYERRITGFSKMFEMSSRRSAELPYQIETKDEDLQEGIVIIGDDGRCECHCGNICPLGRAGSSLRCTVGELAAGGVEFQYRSLPKQAHGDP